MTFRWRWLGFAILALGSAQFAYLGPRRTATGALDLAAPYAGARAWAAGANPYDSAVLGAVLRSAGREAEADPPFTVALYPPPTFLAMMPLAALDWPIARILWLIGCLLLLAVAVRALARRSGLSGRHAWVLAGVVLCLAPLATGFALGQLAIPAILILAIALERIEANALTSGGVLLALAMLLKPQLCALFVAYFALRGPRRPAVVGVACYAIAAVVTITWLSLNDVPWMHSLAENARMEVVGGNIDPRGPLSAQMIDSRPLFTALFGPRVAVSAGLAASVVVAVAIATVSRSLPRRHDHLLLANVAVLTLLTGYHRFYDAALLCIPVAWAVATAIEEGRRHRTAIATIGCCIPFAVSGAWTLQRLGHEGRVAGDLQSSWLWNAVILRHQTWALLVLQCILLVAASRLRASESPEPNGVRHAAP